MVNADNTKSPLGRPSSASSGVWRVASMVCLCVLVFPSAVHANGIGENLSWQFMTTADKTNRAFIEELRQRQNSGAYNAPIYNTFIDRQFNCNVQASASGNQGTVAATAASPNTNGNSAQAAGNQSVSQFDPLGQIPNGTQVDSQQQNSGQVGASTTGDVATSVAQNTSSQVLNSDQSNTAPQTASVAGSTGCVFGALN